MQNEKIWDLNLHQIGLLKICIEPEIWPYSKINLSDRS